MGGCIFVLEGATPAEVARKRTAKLKEAGHEGLYLDRESKVQRTHDGKKFFAVLRVHS